MSRKANTVEEVKRKLLLYHTVESNGCWNWTRSRDRDGYGKIILNGIHCHASRASYLCFKGPLTPSQVVRHTCDNPPCVNPEHLVAGTWADNEQDKLGRGRAPVGERHSNATLSTSVVFQIRATTGQVSGRAIAQQLNIAHTTVNRIRNGTARKYD